MSRTSLLASLGAFSITAAATITLLLLLLLPGQRINTLVILTINPADYGPLCDSVTPCRENISFINCQSEVDGPAYYVDSTSGDVLASCGGYCMGGACDLEACTRYGSLCN